MSLNSHILKIFLSRTAASKTTICKATPSFKTLDSKPWKYKEHDYEIKQIGPVIN